MVDISSFSGESALLASLTKKRDAAQAKLTAHITKAQEKIAPMQSVVDKLDAMIALMAKPGVTGDIEKTANEETNEEKEPATKAPAWSPDQPLDTLGENGPQDRAVLPTAADLMGAKFGDSNGQ